VSTVSDKFFDLFGTLAEGYKEVVIAEKTSASPSAHDQAPKAIQPTGETVDKGMRWDSIGTWLASNWLTLVFVAVVILLLIALAKWVF
jgi:disulfide bond formation protein DsbB